MAKTARDLVEMFEQAAFLHQAGRLDQAERLYRRVLNAKRNHVEAHYQLAVLRARQGRLEEALELIGGALRFKPDHLPSLSAQALLLSQRGRFEDALAALERALALEPNLVELLNNRGNILRELGRPDDALASYGHALALQPDYPEALNNRGSLLVRLGRPAEGLASFDLALMARPDDLEVLCNRGNALSALKRSEEALASFDRALKLHPNDVDVLASRAFVLQQLGRHTAAIEVCDKALALAPERADVRSCRIFLLDFIPELGFAEHQEARRQWFEAHGKPLASTISPHPNAPDPERRLVLGYVSADFKEHSASRTFGPQLEHHDHRQFEVICYSGVTSEDARTREFQSYADKWVSAHALSDDALAAQIRADRVDILVDLSGHTDGHRLHAFARKPAPVQVTAWGHATGTGLRTIDYLFSDPVSVAAAARPLFAETIYDLPCQITFEAAPYAPEPTDLPAQGRGAVTFGCLNRFGKVTAEVLEVWARVLDAVPGARLLLKDTALDDPALQAFARDTLAAQGIGPERITLRGGTPRIEHLATFGEVDIALDPFPQNGGASTWEALWQGVPVVAKLGITAPGRLSGAILSAVGLTDWIVTTDDGYARLAIAKAADLAALATLRRGLRAMVEASAAGNPVRYTRAVEDAYRTIWRRWCAQPR